MLLLCGFDVDCFIWTFIFGRNPEKKATEEVELFFHRRRHSEGGWVEEEAICLFLNLALVLLSNSGRRVVVCRFGTTGVSFFFLRLSCPVCLFLSLTLYRNRCRSFDKDEITRRQ